MKYRPQPKVPYLSLDMEQNIDSFITLMREEGACTLFDFQTMIKKSPYKQAEIVDIVPVITEMQRRNLIEKRTISVSEPNDQYQIPFKAYGFFLVDSTYYHSAGIPDRYGFDAVRKKIYGRNARIT